MADALNYAEAGGEYKATLGFDDISIRAGFIRKVFSLVTIMLAVVAVMSAMPFIFPGMKDFIQDNIAYYFIGYGVFIVVYFVLICIPSARRSFPYNLIAAGILNLSIGYMVMVIVSFHDVESVLIALIITTCASAAIIVFAFQTKYDFTSWIGKSQ
uniref:Uncharacterized protein n=1 Tax=Panagrolaimus davidi TaxID=227884 RepID=A0A914PT82_9BILA